MERERTVARSGEPGSEERAGVARVARLPQLVDALAGADAEDRPQLATELNELLIAMRAPGQEAAESAVVQAALNGKQLHGVLDEQGRSCRKEAVETLLATGFPHALEVSPEDLAFARTFRPRPPRRQDGGAPGNAWNAQLRVRRKGAAILAGLGSSVTVIANLAALPGRFNVFSAFSILLAVITAWVSIALAQYKTDTTEHASFGAAIGITGLLQVVCGAGAGLAGVPALVGAVAALAALYGGQYDGQGR